MLRLNQIKWVHIYIYIRILYVFKTVEPKAALGQLLNYCKGNEWKSAVNVDVETHRMNRYCKRDFSAVCLVHRTDMSVLY